VAAGVADRTSWEAQVSAAEATRVGQTLRAVLPRGGALPDHAWKQRHRAICLLLWLHVAVLPVLGVLSGKSVFHSLLDVAVVAACAAWAQATVLNRTLRASLATLGLLASSALLVHFYNGLIELHFHFFVIIAVVSLYQAWTPYLLGVGFVLLHHGLVGVLAAPRVFNHPAAQHHPAGFALLHGAFVLAESLACLTYWRLTEDSLDAERRQRAETEVSNDALSKANRQISDLVAMLSHDLRTPLTVVNGYATLALQRWPELNDPQRREFMERVGRAGRSLEELLEDTLAASAFDAGALSPRPQPVDLGAVLREVLHALSHPLPGLLIEQPEGVAAVYMDRGHLKQVLANVVSNAGKYGAAPYRVALETDADAVLLRVADHGPGVPPEFVPHLFERYSRSEAARRGAQAGTGLGLFIARALMHANGGDITYEREVDGGSAFVLRLPQVPRETIADQLRAASTEDDPAPSPMQVV
jgi:signal transduction histidine kinase